MSATSSRARGIATALFLTAPLASLLINGISWLHYGIDLPFYDDIRPFLTRTATSLDPRVLFVPANDTLYPVGMALDALAQRYLNGNSVAYQFISMMVLLGGLLALQWRLLMWALQDRLHGAAAFSLSLFMLWPQSYWGLQNLAYHHGLPMLFLLGALAIMLTTAWAIWWRLPSILLLGLLAGFSYISGAFATLAAGMTLFVLSIYLRTKILALRSGALSLLAAGLVTVCAQLWVILSHQQGRISDPAAPWAWPVEASFWMFILGKIGRGLALPMEHPGFSLVVVLLVLALVIALLLRFAGRIAREQSKTPDEIARTAVVFLALTAILAAYLPLLSAGRAYLDAPATRTLMAMFIHGLPEHYHSFWVTLLFPWIGAAVLVIWRPAVRERTNAYPYLAPAAAVAVIIGASVSGAFAHSAYYRTTMEWRMRGDVACVRRALETGKVECPERYAPQLIGVLTYARQIGSSFVRYFPFPPIPLGTEEPPPLYRLSTGVDRAALSGAPLASGPDGFAFSGSSDPMLTLALPAGTLAACWELEVTMEVQSDRDEVAELFTLTPDQQHFTAPSSSHSFIAKGGPRSVTLRAYSLRGFKDSLRIDPVAGDDPYLIKDLEVRCRAAVPGPMD